MDEVISQEEILLRNRYTAFIDQRKRSIGPEYYSNKDFWDRMWEREWVNLEEVKEIQNLEEIEVMPINQLLNSIWPVAATALDQAFDLNRTRQNQKKYQIEEKEAANEVKALKENRQAIIDPSTALEDLSGTFSNPYANLGVATKAAEMQMEQTDAALANTLDTLRATGSGAGGATALAQAALQSKKGVTASIEQQEAANQQMRAQGQAQLQTQIAAEKTRIQQGKVAGIEYVYNAEEERTNADLDYEANKEARSDQKEYNLDQQILSMQNNASFLGNLAGGLLDNTKLGSLFGG